MSPSTEKQHPDCSTIVVKDDPDFPIDVDTIVTENSSLSEGKLNAIVTQSTASTACCSFT